MHKNLFIVDDVFSLNETTHAMNNPILHNCNTIDCIVALAEVKSCKILQTVTTKESPKTTEKGLGSRR